QARARDPPHLQRLLVLGTALCLRPLAGPARRNQPDPSGLGPEQARITRSLERRRPVCIPRLEQGSQRPKRLITLRTEPLWRDRTRKVSGNSASHITGVAKAWGRMMTLPS